MFPDEHIPANGLLATLFDLGVCSRCCSSASLKPPCADTWRNIRDDLKQIKLAQLSSPNGTVWQVTASACGKAPKPVDVPQQESDIYEDRG